MRKLANKSTKAPEEKRHGNTNYCNVLPAAVIDGVVTPLNPEGYSSVYKAVNLTKKESTILLTVSKDGKNIANVNLVYNTRDGSIRNDTTITLLNKDYGSTVDWMNSQKAIRKYLVDFIRNFSALNKENYVERLAKGKVETVLTKNVTPRAYNYNVDSYSRKGCYCISKLGTVFYRRTCEVHPKSE